jgi:hypothetical protein
MLKLMPLAPKQQHEEIKRLHEAPKIQFLKKILLFIASLPTKESYFPYLQDR